MGATPPMDDSGRLGLGWNAGVKSDSYYFPFLLFFEPVFPLNFWLVLFLQPSVPFFPLP